jgi:hypothetical protein
LAIMLGRLRMSIDQCEGAYARFSQDIFTPQSSTAIGRKRDFITAEGKFSTEALEAYIKELIDAAGLRASEKLEDLRADSPKTFVFQPKVSIVLMMIQICFSGTTREWCTCSDTLIRKPRRLQSLGKL